MRFGAVVTRAVWEDSRWRVTMRDGSSVTGTYLVTATGFLSQPKVPDIDGVGEFRGKVIHTTAWDDDYDLTGKRAAVIGTGATAVQLIPEVAKVVSALTVYQRTPIWVSPKPDYRVPRRLRAAFAAVPLTQRVVRLVGSAVLELMMISGVPGVRGCDRARVPEPVVAQQSVRLQRPVVLHHHRVPDEARGPVVHGEATLLRPTSTVAAHRGAVRFPVADYTYA
jgi:cation diffusion facilitator CzcD-associated flavoprotein CzcO